MVRVAIYMYHPVRLYGTHSLIVHLVQDHHQRRLEWRAMKEQATHPSLSLPCHSPQVILVTLLTLSLHGNSPQLQEVNEWEGGGGRGRGATCNPEEVVSKCQLSVLLPEGKRATERQLYSESFTLREAAASIFKQQ